MYDSGRIKEARSLYVFKSMSIPRIAVALNIPHRTISRWKSDAKSNGDCWKSARTNALMAGGGTGNLDILLSEFITFFNATMEEVKADGEMSPLDKVGAIASLGDAYTKVIKSAGKTDPAKTQLAIALDVIKKLMTYLETSGDTDAITALVPHLEPFGIYYKKASKNG